MHAQVRSLAGTPAQLLARVSPTPIADELAFVVSERTGIEDVRAAFSLVRRRLHIVCGSGGEDTLREALARRSARARTRLVDLLQRGAEAINGRPPMMLLEYSGRYEIDATAADAAPPPPPPLPKAPFRMMMLGTTLAADLDRNAVGTDAQQRRVVTVASLRTHFVHYLAKGVRGGGGDDDDAEDSDELLRPRLGAPSLVASAAGDASDVDEVRVVVFSASDVDAMALAAIDYRRVDNWVRGRLRTLIHTYRTGRLGDDIDDEELDEAADSYPPPIDDSAVERYLSRERALRAREAAIVHVVCKLVKGVAETWFIEAERRLVERRLDAERAKQHAVALRAHIDLIEPMPELDEAPEDVYSLFEKLHFLRSYLAERHASE